MAKIKVNSFELVAILKDSKKIIDYLQKIGIVELENVEDENLRKSKADDFIEQADELYAQCINAINLVEKYAVIKKSMIQSLVDYKHIDYSEYKTMSSQCQGTNEIVQAINEYEKQITIKNELIIKTKEKLDYHNPWVALDLPMFSSRTLTTTLFIGSFDYQITQEELLVQIQQRQEDLQDVAMEIVSSEKAQTCLMLMCHNSSAQRLGEILGELGFVVTQKPEKKLASGVIENCIKEIDEAQNDIINLQYKIADYADSYEKLRFLSDYLLIQKEKYTQIENTAMSDKTIYVKGYIAEKLADEVKFKLEKDFTCQFNYYEPDYENADVPVLIQNNSFAAGVESVTNMYSPPSNKDIDPNPVMAVFYYAFFGLMLSDAGYGLIMLLGACFAKYRLKVIGETKKMADMIFYCGISTIIWGMLFGGFFGDLIQTLAVTFLGSTDPPTTALWFEPMVESMDLLIFSFIIGLVHLYSGLILRSVSLIKQKDYFGAIFDVVPVMIFVAGFAIIGGGLLTDIPQNVSALGVPLLAVGSGLIVLTAGRSAKNIVGKFGGGLFALYNTVSGYLGDILSYSRILALCLVTGVIANVVNLLGGLSGNIIIFFIIFILGHTVNIAINLIGTYVHTNRLQYIEFFSKFYEGAGRSFTPFKFKSKYFIIKEENNNG